MPELYVQKTLEDLKLLNALCHGTVLDDAIALLTGQQQIVRCKNCIFGHWWSSEQVIVCDKLAKALDANWFCADGVKKDD